MLQNTIQSEVRFGGIDRLYPDGGLDRLKKARVCVVGIGGVGSWAAEALARSGIGHLSLVDLDDICLSNINRQLIALESLVGQSKVAAMAKRIQEIHPECRMDAVNEFFTPDTAAAILAPRFDFVVDAIDQLQNKCLLIAHCCQANIPVICCGGAGGRRNPSAWVVDDLSRSCNDPLLQRVRKILREEYDFPLEPKARFGVPSVFSREKAQRVPGALPGGGGCNGAYGTASFVTGTCGFLAAAHVVNSIASGKPA